jgi:mono/diheme cytochrome c family protein
MTFLLSGSPVQADRNYDEVQRGQYLTTIGDCQRCHTANSGKPFAGGRPIPTPFGTIYSANITPDRTTGIGAWSDDQFWRAMNKGIAADGHRLYPAFPYPYFTHTTREDVDAIRAYLRTVEPVESRPPANELPFPIDQRSSMLVWNWLYFDQTKWRPNLSKSDEWNRGSYLVESLGHCGACHTPKNFLGGDKTNEPLAGGSLQNWLAPDLGPGRRDALGGWSIGDIVEYLSTGRNRHDNAAGPMAEVVEYSTSRLAASDLRAIAVYLKDIPGRGQGSATDNAKANADQNVISAGEAIYTDQCSACHKTDGTGVERMFPPLRGNPAVQQQDPTSVVRVILEGARSASTNATPTAFTMPRYDWKLSDEEIAAVATYVRNSWGNVAPSVAASNVRDTRSALAEARD